MTRRIVKVGFPGPGQTIFPEEAKEEGRSLALVEEFDISHNEGEVVAGVREDNWQIIEEGVRGRIDIVGVRLPNKMTADQVNEGVTHVIRLDPTAIIDSGDRIVRELDGSTWAVLSVGHRTGEPTIFVEAKLV